MIDCENGIGNSLGGVKHSRSSVSWFPGWLRNPRRNSSFARHNSSFLACDTARSSWMRSCSTFDAAIASWRPYIPSMTCCKVMPSLSSRVVELCLLVLILHSFLENLELFLQILELSSVELNETWRLSANLARILKNLHKPRCRYWNSNYLRWDCCFSSAPWWAPNVPAGSPDCSSCVASSCISRTPSSSFQISTLRRREYLK